MARAVAVQHAHQLAVGQSLRLLPGQSAGAEHRPDRHWWVGTTLRFGNAPNGEIDVLNVSLWPPVYSRHGELIGSTRFVASIRRANLDGSGVEDLVMEASSRPRSIALDVSGGKLYWTDNGTNSIGRANLDGSGAEDFVTGLSSYATGIALDPTGGMIYWIDDDADRIQRANLDGTGVEDIVMSGLAWPHGLAVDPVNQKLYWSHRRGGKITRANLDGTSISNVVVSDGNNLEFYGIALH